MFGTLYSRLLAVILGFGVTMTAIFAFILLVYHESYHTEADQTANRRLAQQYANARLLIADEPLTVNNFHEGIRKLADLNPDVDIYLIDADGALVAASVPEELWVRRKVDLAPVDAFLRGTDPLPIFGDDPRFSDSREIFSASPVHIRDCPARFLYVILHKNHSATNIRQLRQNYTINESLGLLASCGLLAVLAALVAIRMITARLGDLRTDMERFQNATVAGNDTGISANCGPRRDEIEHLAGLFRNLSARVHRQMEALRDTDNMRRNMVANISHDLRTPLTTLQAHLDSLALKDSRLAPAERAQYLDTAITQCRRLTRLVSQLLELARLDAGQIVPEKEPFQLAELIQDITQELALTAAEKKVALHAEYSASLPLVLADISLIERAIDNLVENAIRHTPPGGRITLRAAATGADAVRIEVEDSGPGVPPEEQAKIFDRFYRGDPSRPADAAHAGLGLAIVKGLLDLHGSTIELQSDPGHGACFNFELPAFRPSKGP